MDVDCIITTRVNRETRSQFESNEWLIKIHEKIAEYLSLNIKPGSMATDYKSFQ